MCVCLCASAQQVEGHIKAARRGAVMKCSGEEQLRGTEGMIVIAGHLTPLKVFRENLPLDPFDI